MDYKTQTGKTSGKTNKAATPSQGLLIYKVILTKVTSFKAETHTTEQPRQKTADLQESYRASMNPRDTR